MKIKRKIRFKIKFSQFCCKLKEKSNKSKIFICILEKSTNTVNQKKKIETKK